MLVYLAGPMSGIPYCNYPLFDEVAMLLRGGGLEVISPADNNRADIPDIESTEGHITGLGEMHDSTLRQRLMKTDLHSVLVCDVVAMLPGWENSTGSMIERRVAECLGKLIWLVVPGESVGISQYKWITLEDPVQIRCDARSFVDVQGGPIDPVADAEAQKAERAHETGSPLNESAPAGTNAPAPSPIQGKATETPTTTGQLRTFETGATRQDDSAKPDPEGYLSPYALAAYFEYMRRHGIGPDGQPRPSDNWQCGIPFDAYMKSMWRHFLDVWALHRGLPVEHEYDLPPHPVDLTEALCGLLFNVMGMLHEWEKLV